VAFTIVEFHFLSITSSHKSLSGADSYQTFYSLYHLSVTLVAIVIQTLLTSRIINSLGLKNTFLIFPIALVGSLAWLLVFPTSLVGVVAGLMLPWLSKNTVDESARKSFQALVPPERRGRVSMFMDSYLFAAGAITGSLILGAVILLDKSFDLPSPYYIYLAVAAAATLLTVWFTLRMRAAYDASLLNWRLKRRQRASGVLDKLDFDS
jgi:MFS family permease